MVSVDGSLFIQIINFLFLLYALNLVLFKPVRKILLDRKEKIYSLEKGVERLASRSDEKDMAYKEGIKNARTEGLKKKEAMIDQASQEEKEILDKITMNAQANLAKIRAQVTEETEKARVALEDELDVFARAIGEKILGRAC
ncbi:AtpF3 [Desulfamplus magnetovallimortis]|uniref:AtpF3 n=1 Tax=Desulfamplus magnetovallimortis TaxID=1246637 RepID=A0A1W1H904_9BACT|nr:ATP synthase F0 subunit B [Desulfamplus magnetovallimortis]SLM28967.1 AtpF3 [Desulfamplus magnetovallimortis]